MYIPFDEKFYLIPYLDDISPDKGEGYILFIAV